MTTKTFDIEGLVLIKPDVFSDERGYFMETYNHRDFYRATGIEARFVQDNESLSRRGVIRGLHFQRPPHGQGKLVRVVRGKALDVAVDIRSGSPTFGMHQSVLLSEDNKLRFYVPPGFAHGLAVLEDDTVFAYKCTAYHHRDSECTLQWNDPALGIDWMLVNPILSDKDREGGVTLDQLNSGF